MIDVAEELTKDKNQEICSQEKLSAEEVTYFVKGLCF